MEPPLPAPAISGPANPFPPFLAFLWIDKPQALSYLAILMTLNFARMAIPKAGVVLAIWTLMFAIGTYASFVYRIGRSRKTAKKEHQLAWLPFSWKVLKEPRFWIKLFFWASIGCFFQWSFFELLLGQLDSNPATPDRLNLFFLLGWLFVLSRWATTKDDFVTFLGHLRAAIAFLGTLAAGLGLLKWMWSLTMGTVPDLLNLSTQPMGTSLVTDYNYYGLFLLAGIACFLAPFSENPKLHSRPFWLTLTNVTLFGTAILATGSRRCLIAFILLQVILLIQSSFARRKFGLVNFNNFGKPILLGFFLAHLLLGIVWLWGFMTNQTAPRLQFGLITYRYASLIPSGNVELAPNFNTWYEVLYDEPVNMPLLSDGLNLQKGIANGAKSQEELHNLWFWKPSDSLATPAPSESRTARWTVAIHRFQRAQATHLFGEGFYSYPYAFAQRFKTGAITDHPHNPFLNALLYGGLPAAIAYVLWVLAAIWGYLKSLRKSPLLQTFWPMGFIALGFSMTSDFSPFSAPLVTFLLLLPMLTLRREVAPTQDKSAELA